MNGNYQPILTYLDNETFQRINNLKEKKREEFKFRFKNFYDKYSDLFINNLINMIRSANFDKVISNRFWTFEYNILVADTQILDPEVPENAFVAISAFFKKCCESISIQYKECEFNRVENENVIMNVKIFNPLNFDINNEIESILKEI